MQTRLNPDEEEIAYTYGEYYAAKHGEISCMWPWQRIQLVRSPTKQEWRWEQPIRGTVGDFGIVLPDPSNENKVVVRNGLIRVLYGDFVVRWPTSCVEVFRRNPDRRIQRCGGYVRINLRHYPEHKDNGKVGLVVRAYTSAENQYTISQENGKSCEYWFLGDCEPCDAPALPAHHGTIKIGDSVRYVAFSPQGYKQGTTGRVVDLPTFPGGGYWIDVAGSVCCWFSHHFEPCGATGDK